MATDFNIWFRCDLEPEIEDIPEDVEEKMKCVSLEELVRSTEELTLTHMYIRGEIPPLLDQIAPNLTHLRLRDMISVDQLERVKLLYKLEKMNISCNEIKSLPNWMAELPKLRELDVSSCGLTCLHDSMKRLNQLETLNISWNKINILPSVITELCNLRELDVSDCGLTSLPDSIKQLEKLEKLNISDNFINKPPSVIAELHNLRELDMMDCGLTSLPDSIKQLDKLEKLNLSWNEIKTLPSVIAELSNLRELYVSGCGLTSLPDSMKQLEKLEKLSIRGNKIKSLPSVIAELCNLRELDASYCDLTSLPDSLGKLEHLLRLNICGKKSLTSIPLSIFSIRSLTYLDCDGCDSLTSPPYAVAKQGLDAIRQYIEALKEEEGNIKRTFVVTVVGKSLAGKTSLVKSIQQGKRVLTERLEESKFDQATKVLQVAEVKVTDNESIIFLDCGGHEIYHVAYQMTFRSECVLLLVIDIADFDKLASSIGLESACKGVCIDWLSQLYPSCPKLGHPIVVFTHCDQLTEEQLNQRAEELVSTTELLRKSIIDEESNEIGSDLNPVFTMTAFCDMSKPLIALESVFMFSASTSAAQIGQLQKELTHLGSLISMEIPGSWNAMLLYISGQQEKACIPISDIDNKFPADKKNHYILQYIHEIGKLMWFRNHPSLQKYIFHRTDALTCMIGIIFNHAEKQAWVSRIGSFRPIKDSAGQVIDKRKFEEIINRFLRTGIMHADLLIYLLKQESPLLPDVAIDILKAFRLICGPIQDKASNGLVYILPFFSRDEIAVSDNEGCAQLRADIFFNGLPVPVYVYSQSTASFIDLHMSHLNHIHSGMNGARVKDSTKLTKYLLHNSKKSCITIVTSTSADTIAEAWRSQLSTIRKVIAELKSVWKGVRYEVVFYCSHCMATNNSDPTTIVDPAWCHTDFSPSNSSGDNHNYTGGEVFICGSQEYSVPSPFMFPCPRISESGVEKLTEYINSLARQDITSGSLSSVTSHPVPQPAGGLRSEQITVDQILLMMKSGPALLDLNPDTSAANNNNQAVYEVTETRGRALIISNDYNGTRPGSKADYDNIKLMLSKFGFVTAGGHGNFSAKEIVETIHRETQITDGSGESVHRKLGTFVLVITSHGGKGSIIGCDGIQIELTDIYNLLSPKNFPAMKGKPKLIIVQACSGVKREMLLDDQPPQPPTPASSRSAGDYLHMFTSDYQADSGTRDISVSDLIIMQACFDSFVSARHPEKGSPFIRAIVLAFYRLGHKYHIEELANVVRECVMKFGAEKTAENLRTSTDESGYIAQVPKTVCTFTGLRKLYLRPDALTEHHPQEVTNPVYPNPTSTAIIPGRGRFVMEDQEGSDIKITEYYQWRVVDNSRRVRPTPSPRLSLSPSQHVRPRPTPVPRPTPARRTQPENGAGPV